MPEPVATTGGSRATVVRLCGALQVTIRGTDVTAELKGPQPRMLFACLALNRERTVSRDELIDVLWPSNPPRSPGAGLNVVLTRVRNAVGGDVIVGGRQLGLRLDDDAEIDVEVAEREAAAADAALAAGDPHTARAAADRGLALVAHELLPGLEGEWIPRARFADLRARLLEARGRAGLALGGPELAAAERMAAELVEREPYRETTWMLLMDIQARRGDVAEALQTFERLRVLLRDELGAAPSPAVLELHGRLLRHSPESRPAAAVRVPLPPIGAATDGRFVGRAAELRRLAGSLGRAGRGRWPVVFLTGEAGVGKTALAARFAAEVHQGGGTVLYGRCDEEPIGPYQPFVEALRQRINCPGWDAVGQLEPLGAVLPEVRERLGEPPAVPGELQRALLFDCVGRALGAWSEPSLLLILDDVHWADEPTAKLLRHLARSAGPQRLMILATHRDEQREIAPTLANLFLELRKDNCLDRLRLRGLDAGDTVALAERMLEQPVEDEFARALHQRTDGNPFFISEALLTLRASSLVAPGEAVSARALDQVGAPEGVQALIVRSLSKVSETTAGALSAAAAIGREFDVGVVAETIGVSTGDALAAVEEAEAWGLVAELPQPYRYTFSHAIVRSAIYERLSGSRRAWWHERVAAVLEARDASRRPAELAHHFTLAGSSRAIDYALEAGREAAAALAYEEAERHLEQAVRGLRDLGPEHESRRCRALLDLGRVLRRTGRTDRSRECFDEVAASARRRGDAEQLARAALGVGERYWEANIVDARYRELLEEALRALEDAPGGLRARVMARLAENLAFTPARERSQQLSVEALAIARRLEDVDVLIATLTARHVVLLGIEHVEERLALIEEILELRGDRRELWAEAQQWRLYDLCELGRVDEARAHSAELSEVARQLRQPFLRHVAAHWRGVFAELAGDVEQTERIAEETLALGRQAQSFDALSTSVAKLYMLRRRQGRLEELIEDIRTLADMPIAPAAWPAAMALACLVTGREEEGRVRAQRLIDALEEFPRDFFWLSAVAVLAECAALLGDAARAQRLYESLAPYAGRFVQVSFAACLGSLERYLGLLAQTIGRTAVAEDHLRRALAANRSLGSPVLTAVTQVDYAALLLGRGGEGDRQRAAELGAAAQEVAESLGLAALVQDATRAQPAR